MWKASPRRGRRVEEAGSRARRGKPPAEVRACRAHMLTVFISKKQYIYVNGNPLAEVRVLPIC